MEIRGNELGAPRTPQLKGEPARRVLLLSVNGSNFKKRMSKEINDVLLVYFLRAPESINRDKGHRNLQDKSTKNE